MVQTPGAPILPGPGRGPLPLSRRVPNGPRHECNTRELDPRSGTVSSVGVTCIFHYISVFFVGAGGRRGGLGRGVSNIKPRVVQHQFLILKQSMFDGTNLHY